MNPDQWNARFWWYGRKGWVKITLKPDQWLTWGWAEENEEGYSSEGVTFYHAGDVVECSFATGGRDCDGPHSSYIKMVCPVSELASDPYVDDEEEIMRPNWKKVEEEVYDAYAQAANY